MRVYYGFDEIPESTARAFVTIGNFDGVHRGHQLLFERVAQQAARDKGLSAAITFDPHPLEVLRPQGIKLINTTEQKVELIRQTGIDILLILPFTRELAATPAADFIDEITKAFPMRELVVGYDYAFGRGREGDIPFLKEQGQKKGFTVTVIDALTIDGEIVSSTRIRKLVSQGRMRDVARLMGRPYQIRGEVKVGQKRGGAEIGFPTANLHISPDDLCPRHGVYVVQVTYGGRCYGGVMNIGKNPTFDRGSDPTIMAETHIFDFNQDIYGQPIKINFLRYLRGERRFNGIAELSAQIARDVEEAKKVLEEARRELLLACEDSYNH